MPAVSDYHAHIYFDTSTIEQAQLLCERAKDAFSFEMGRFHKRLVGPHPMWSCQLKFDQETFGEIIPWLALNRDGLVIFIHPNTGNVVKDHTEHAIWMGQMMALDLTVFSQMD